MPGLAGIYVWDVGFLDLYRPIPSNSNNFSRMVSGIVAFRTNLWVNSCAFNNIKSSTSYQPFPLSPLGFQGCGVHGQAEKGGYYVRVIGMAKNLLAPPTFNNCDVGVSFLGIGALDAAACYMNNIQNVGILARSSNLISSTSSGGGRIEENIMTNLKGTGIGTYYFGANATLRISGNTISFNNGQSSSSNIGVGINVQEYPNSLKGSRLSIFGNIITTKGAFRNGIIVSGHYASKETYEYINNNIVYMDGPAADRTGIAILNSNVHLSCNEVEGSSVNRNKGIIGSMVQGGLWDCNSVDRTQVGVFLEGNNRMELKGTVFRNHTTGLLYESNAVNLLQDHNGNRWVGNMTFPVRNLNNVSTHPGSAFIINPTAANLVPSNATSFPDWINLLGNDPNYDCNNPQQIICGTPILPLLAAPSPNVNAIDIALANNTFTTATHTAAAQYSGKRKLFRKLLENPSLVQTDPSLPSFVPNHQNTCIAHFDNVAQGIEQAFTVSSLDSIQLDSFQNQCKYYLDSLHCLDSLLYANYDTTTANLRTALSTDFSLVIQQQQVFLANLSANQQANLAPIQATNSNFVTNVLYENLEKQVNDIYLNTLALGIAEFTPSQIADLQIIAAYCPQEGGAAVHQARGMLSMIQDVDMLNFDCNRSQARKAQTDEAEILNVWEVILYPNPTSSKLTIHSNLIFESNASIEIFNALGQLIKTKLIVSETNNVIIDASSLLDGVYIMRLKNGENIVSKTFVVSK